MRQSELEKYVNPIGAFNTTHYTAWVMAWRACAWSRHNIFQFFAPPLVQSVEILPSSPDGDLEFDPAWFQPTGPLCHYPLNHYLQIVGGGRKFAMNAGFLLGHFALGDKYGYAAIKRALAGPAANLAGRTNSIIQAPGTEDPE